MGFFFCQQVCQTLKRGNWTVERDEDLTGPYGFGSDSLWMAFDDSTSLKIKTKYALLRNLGGVALDSIEADDVDNVCGNGEQSLLKSIRKTLTQLERKTRQLIVHSLEEDLVSLKSLMSLQKKHSNETLSLLVARLFDCTYKRS